MEHASRYCAKSELADLTSLTPVRHAGDGVVIESDLDSADARKK